MNTKPFVKIVCGCGEKFETDQNHPLVVVMDAAYRHANDRNHTMIITGEIRVQKGPQIPMRREGR